MTVLKKVLPALSLVSSLLFVTTSVVASSEYEQACRDYAKEDQVPKEEMDFYIKECVQSLQSSQEENDSTTEELKEDLK